MTKKQDQTKHYITKEKKKKKHTHFRYMNIKFFATGCSLALLKRNVHKLKLKEVKLNITEDFLDGTLVKQ